MKEIGKERKIAIVALIIAVLMLTVAFAAMSRTLKINGTAKVDSAAWDIHFKSAEMISKKGDAREVQAPSITNGGIDLTLKVGLRKPKDEITYEAVIINEGDIDAEIESIEYPSLTEDQAKIIEFVATYQNGDEISKSQELAAKEEKTVKIVIRYKDITDESLLAKEAYDIPLTFKINYVQKGFNTESIPGGDIIVDDGTKAVLASTDVMSSDPMQIKFANSPMLRTEIETLTFTKSNGSARSGESWDASEAGDGSITGYYQDSDGNGLYEVVIESSSNIFAPVDSSAFFAAMVSLKEINFNNFKTDDTTNMMGMFLMCSSLTSLDLTSFDTSNVTDMSMMFMASPSLITVDMSNLDVSNVTNMSMMFFSGSDGNDYFDSMNLENIYMDGWDTSSVTAMDDMFTNCGSLTSLDLSSFNTSNVTSMKNMFSDCAALISLDLSLFDTNSVMDMSMMFEGCASLIELKLNSANFDKVDEYKDMFDGISNITIYVNNQTSSDFIVARNVLNENVTVIIEPLQS